ncbi:hypothetical protein FRC05_005257 [Tulasnella sp. 425]|nr:hypothetical protein FRC05_005257 [Tulasnella sp. 425]
MTQLVLSLILANESHLPEPQPKRPNSSPPTACISRPALFASVFVALFKHPSNIDQAKIPRLTGACGAKWRSCPRWRTTQISESDRRRGERLIQWRLGSRARAEVEERNVGGFICDFMKKSWLDEQEKLLGEDEEEEERTAAGRKGKSVVRNPEHPVEKETELKDIAEKYGKTTRRWPGPS